MEFLIPAALAVMVVLFLVSRQAGQDSLDVYYDQSDGERQHHRWGYSDTVFEFDSPRTVRVTGSRYPLSGYSMPNFIPFAEEVLGLPIRQEDIVPEITDKQIEPSRLDEASRAALGKVLAADQISDDDGVRLRAAWGRRGPSPSCRGEEKDVGAASATRGGAAAHQKDAPLGSRERLPWLS